MMVMMIPTFRIYSRLIYNVSTLEILELEDSLYPWPQSAHCVLS
jgi:hypothetical protein